jgi:hypothetical protein
MHRIPPPTSISVIRMAGELLTPLPPFIIRHLPPGSMGRNTTCRRLRRIPRPHRPSRLIQGQSLPRPTAGDIIGDGHILHLKYLSGIDKVVLLNPAAPIVAVPNATTSVRGLVEISTAAEFQNDTADRGLTGEVVWDAAATVALTDAATVTVDFSTGINFTLLINGNRTLGSPSNEKVGQSGFIKITKTSAGQTLAYGSEWKFAGGTDPVLSTSASDTDVLHYQVIASGFIAASLGKAYA